MKTILYDDYMMSVIKYSLFGYLSGNILYARVFARLFGRKEMIASSPDHNPGTANAFLYGGFWCGVLTLLGDVTKGFFPVWLALCNLGHHSAAGLSFIIAAPVFGHLFPIFYRFRGGKGIAVTFGCLLGMMPVWRPFAFFAGSFLLFSLVIRITPHYHRTLVSYIVTLICFGLTDQPAELTLAFLFITCAVCIRFLLSREPKEAMRVRLF